MSVNRVLVTGSKGFVGTHLCTSLLGRDIEIIDKDTFGSNNNRLDITNLHQLSSIDKRIQVIVHLGAKTSIHNSMANPYETYYTNLLGTLNLLEFARIKHVGKFINLSTYVYGHPKYLPIDEKHPTDPHSPYNKSKLIAEKVCEFYSHDFGIDIVTLRPFCLYGPQPRPNSLIYSIFDQIENKNGRVLLSGEFTRRDFLFIDDFTKVIEIILDNFPVGYNIFNVGYGSSHTLKEVAEIIARLIEKKIVLEFNNNTSDNATEITDMVADISKISNTFNWKPSISLEKGLEFCISKK